MHSLYLHIPFCRHRCAYCDFNTYAGQEDLIPAYVDALCREIEFVGSQLPSPPGRGAGGEGRVHTIYFGGGTPSLLTAGQFEKILAAIRENFEVLFDAETSLEANPGTVSLTYLRGLHDMGFNRLSLGVQSAHADELRQLERSHDFFDVIEAVKLARMAGFDNLNLDLIYGLLEQPLDRWQATVKLALGLHPEHLSLYALTIEHGTPFGRWSARGRMPSPDPDLAADMYEWAGEYLSEQGYEQYEISNWARSKDEGGRRKAEENFHPSSFILSPSYACRHNLQYWRNQPFLGFGAGAHGWAGGYRYSNVLRIKTYIERLADGGWQACPERSRRVAKGEFPLSPATVKHQRITAKVEMQETMLTGLRLTREGVSDADFRSRFGIGIEDAFPEEVSELLRLDLVEWVSTPPSYASRITHHALRLTPRARLVANQVFMRFVD